MSQDATEPLRPAVDPAEAPTDLVEVRQPLLEQPDQETVGLTVVRPARKPEDVELAGPLPSRRHAARKPEPEADSAGSFWPEAFAMLGLGLLVACVALSTVFPFNTPVQDFERAGLIITGLMAFATVTLVVAAVSFARERNMRVMSLYLFLALVPCANWCSWLYSFNIVEYLQSLL